MNDENSKTKATTSGLLSRMRQRLGNSRFLAISIAAHLLFLLVAAVLVVQTVSAKRKLTFSSSPPSPNPSQRSLEHKVQMARKQNTMSAPAQAKRIVTTGLSKVSLPDMPAITASEIAPGKMAGMGGKGFGMGAAGGMGGTGSGGGGGPIPLFGMRDPGKGLKGTFYDLKQTRAHKPTNMDPKLYAGEISEFLKRGWSAAHLSRFYKAPTSLYATQIFMPDMDANKGPAAFSVEKEVQPRMWIVHYKGTVTPTENGVYHFVGRGDDIVLVRFENKLVLSACYDNPSDSVETKWVPKGSYNYGWPPNCPLSFIKGDAIDVRAGVPYPIEILIGESPGGRCAFALMLEKEGATYKKDARGNPILPVFRLADSKMPPLEPGETLPVYEERGPLWKVLEH